MVPESTGFESVESARVDLGENGKKKSVLDWEAKGVPDFWDKKFQSPRVSYGNQLLTIEPEDSRNEVGKLTLFSQVNPFSSEG